MSGSGANYTVQVSGLTGPGSLTVQVRSSAAVDAVGNTSTASATTTDRTVTYDPTAPTVTVEQRYNQVDPSSAKYIYYTVTFNEAVTGLSFSDFSFSGGTAPGTFTGLVSGSGKVYTISVTGMTGPGTVIMTLPAGSVIDAAGNGNAESTSVDNSVLYQP